MTWIRQTKVPSRLKGFSVRTSLDCAAAFQKIAFDCVARVKAGHGGVLAGNPEAVHQMRVALTRLRAAVSFFAPMTADAKWRRLKKEIAWLKQMKPAAEDDDLEHDIDATMPVLEQHLTQAMAIQSKLNKPADSTIKRDSVSRRVIRKRL